MHARPPHILFVCPSSTDPNELKSPSHLLFFRTHVLSHLSHLSSFVCSPHLVKWESGGGCEDQMAQFLGFRAYGPTSDHHLGGPKTIAGIFQSGFELPFGANPILSRVSLCSVRNLHETRLCLGSVVTLVAETIHLSSAARHKPTGRRSILL